MNYFGVCFGLLTFEAGMKFASSVYYFVFIYVIGLYVIMRVLGIS